MAQVFWDGGLVGFAFLEYLLSRLVEDLTQVTVPLGSRLRREHDCLWKKEKGENVDVRQENENVTKKSY